MRRHLPTLVSVALVAAAIATGIAVFLVGDLLDQRRDPVSGPVDAAERRVVVASAISLGLFALAGLLHLATRLLRPARGPVGDVLAATESLPLKPPMWLLGWPLRMTGAGLWFCIPLVGGAIFATQRAELPLAGKAVLILALVGIGGGLLVAGYLAYDKGRQNTLEAESARAVADPRSPVLYLRPFHADWQSAEQLSSAGGLAFWAFPARSEEDIFARVLAKVGPLVAIGDPEMPFRPVGAMRFEVRGGRWQEAVSALMSRARLVVLRCGYGAGFFWELDLARRTLDPERLIMLVPFDREGYRRFCSVAEPHLPASLPPFPESVHDRVMGLSWGALCFRAGWRAEWAIFATDHKPMAFHMYRRVLVELWPAVERLGVSGGRWLAPSSLRNVAARIAVVIGFLVVVMNVVHWGDSFVWGAGALSASGVMH